MWLTSKIKQVLMVLKPGVVTLGYPFTPHPAPENFRGQPHWDHHKCVGCGACSNHCSARCILVRDYCQEIRVMLYDGSRCTYCGRCADVCPEKAITISTEFELATGDREDVTERLELFMLTCQRCGRCYDMENTNAIERMDLRGYRYDSLETRALIRKTTDQFDRELFEATKNYQRPVK
ncbi:MAG: ferredoxin [Spirochaetae bacterium HGW-Spirochaetae-1]|nr:MAG: ferredoxin [Spirochaetae bacterium HGW-Spirochaetae-1]